MPGPLFALRSVLCRCWSLYSNRCAVREKKIYLFKYQEDKCLICKKERLAGIFAENPFVYMLTFWWIRVAFVANRIEGSLKSTAAGYSVIKEGRAGRGFRLIQRP